MSAGKRRSQFGAVQAQEASVDVVAHTNHAVVGGQLERVGLVVQQRLLPARAGLLLAKDEAAMGVGSSGAVRGGEGR